MVSFNIEKYTRYIMIDTNYVKNTNELRKNAIIKYKVKATNSYSCFTVALLKMDLSFIKL